MAQTLEQKNDLDRQSVRPVRPQHTDRFENRSRCAFIDIAGVSVLILIGSTSYE